MRHRRLNWRHPRGDHEVRRDDLTHEIDATVPVDVFLVRSCLPLWPTICPRGPARLTLCGSTARASNVRELRIATGITPADFRLMLSESLPGLMSIETERPRS